MNTFPFRRKTHLLALWCALLPLIVGGCGGGGNGSSLQTPSPTVAPNMVLPIRALRLPGGRLSILNLSVNGNALTGTLRVLDEVTPPIRSARRNLPGRGRFLGARRFFSVESRRGNELLAVGRAAHQRQRRQLQFHQRQRFQ